MRHTFVWVSLLYLFSVSVLIASIVRFIPMDRSEFAGYFVAGLVVALIAIGWGYLLYTLTTTKRHHYETTLQETIDRILHELNIPVATIRNNVELLSYDADEKEATRLKRIASATERLQKLYTELAYTLRSETEEIAPERFELSTLLKEHIAYFEGFGRQHFRLSLTPTLIEADKIGFEQVVDNLIDNAMKYSDKESEIAITLKEGILRITDHGKGMSETELLRIFELYYQGDSRAKGRGIGLALVKRFCDTHGIAIDIKTAPDKGTSIALDLRKLLVKPDSENML